MKYFKNVQTIEQLRKQYKELLKKYHPDNENGSEEITKAINNEYEQLFKLLKNRKEADNKENTADSEKSYNHNCYDWESDKALREMLAKIINFSGIECEIIGSWLWVSGNTYQYRKELKEYGFKYASVKKMWYYHTEEYRKTSSKKLSIDDIRNYYGTTKVKTGYTRELLEA